MHFDLFTKLLNQRGIFLLNHTTDLSESSLHLLILYFCQAMSKLDVHFDALFLLNLQGARENSHLLVVEHLGELEQGCVVFEDLETDSVGLWLTGSTVHKSDQHGDVVGEVRL